jgi:anti-sigma B factor antagonist
MKHEVIKKQGASIVVLKGDVDLESSPAAREILLKTVDGAGRVLVDLSSVTYIDSSGVASRSRRCRRRSATGPVCLVAARTPAGMELARLTRSSPCTPPSMRDEGMITDACRRGWYDHSPAGRLTIKGAQDIPDARCDREARRGISVSA